MNGSGPTLAIVALGSNLGDSIAILTQATVELRKLAASDFRASSFYKTLPVDCPPGSPSFINAVAVFVPHTGETPESLLVKLQTLEKDFGRQPKKVRNEPRPLDLDLIAFGSELRATPQLTLPHPRAHQRRFVLEPLNQITPDWILPGQPFSVAQLLATLASSEHLECLT
jgi:2-amino-4-hydroxy-6-hydroxymethyldihydropteridine diphosphokinase